MPGPDRGQLVIASGDTRINPHTGAGETLPAWLYLESTWRRTSRARKFILDALGP